MPIFKMADCVSITDIETAKLQFKEHGICCIRGAVNVEDIHQLEVNFSTLPVDPRQPSRKGACTNNDKLNSTVLDTLFISDFLTDEEHQLAFPVEMRRYDQNSQGMRKHVDTTMFSPPQLEAVLTVNNSDNCTKFVWTDKDSNTHSLQPQKGDLMYVLAGKTPHEVTPLCDGRRDIIKFATADKNSSPKEEFINELAACPTI